MVFGIMMMMVLLVFLGCVVIFSVVVMVVLDDMLISRFFFVVRFCVMCSDLLNLVVMILFSILWLSIFGMKFGLMFWILCGLG